jgi:hypothetical protein
MRSQYAALCIRQLTKPTHRVGQTPKSEKLTSATNVAPAI